ncbi:MAG: WD40 repeat domain-containing protein [Planctomycetaceae bacterium]
MGATRSSSGAVGVARGGRLRCGRFRILPRVLACTLACLVAAAPAAPGAEPIVLRGHATDVFMAAFTPDGASVVTAGGDGTARQWDAASGAQTRVFRGHDGPVFALAVSGDGRTLVTAGQDNAARVWALPLPAPRVAVAAHPGRPTALVLLSDGRTASTAGAGSGARQWNLDRLAPAPACAAPPGPDAERQGFDAERRGHAEPITAAAASADGAAFVTADAAGRMLLWSPLLDEPLGSPGLHGGGVVALAAAPDGQRLLSLGADATLRVWGLPPPAARVSAAIAPARDLAIVPGQALVALASDDAVRVIDATTLSAVREFPRQLAFVDALACSPDGALAALADAAGTVRLCAIADGAERARVAGHSGAVHDVAFLPDGKGLLTAGIDGTLRRWSLPAAPAALAGPACATAVAGAPDGSWFAAAGDDRTVRLWSPAGQAVRQFGPLPAPIGALAVTADGTGLAIGDETGTITLWGTADGAARGAILAHAGAVRAVAHDRAGGGLWSAGADGTLKHARLPTTPPRDLAGHAQALVAVAAAADGRIAVSGGEDQSVRVWDTASGQATRSLGAAPAGAVAAVAASRDGALAAAVTATGSIRVWKTADGSAVLERTLPTPQADVAFLGAEALATLAQDGTLRVWSLSPTAAPDAGPAQQIPPPVAECRVLAADPAGTRLVAGGAGGRLVAWRVEGGFVVDNAATGTGAGPGRITDAAFSADGGRLSVGCDDGRVAVWDTAALLAAEAPPRVAFALAVPVRGVAPAADGSRVVAVGDDGATLFDVAAGRAAERFVAAAKPGCVTAAGAAFLTSGADGVARLWTPAVDRVVVVGTTPAEICTALVPLAGEAALAGIVAGTQGVQRWSPAGEAAPPVLGEIAPAFIAATPDGTRLAAIDAQGLLGMWREGQAGTAPLATGAPPTALAIGRTGAEVAVADATPRVRCYAADSGLVLEEAAGAAPIRQLLMVGPESRAWAGFDGTSPGAVRPRSLEAIVAVGAAVEGVAVAGDGARAYAGLADGALVALALPDLRIAWRTPATGHHIRELALAPSGAVVASAGDDATHLWNTADGSPARTLPRPARRAAFSADGKRLATTDADGVAHLWDAASGTALESSTLHRDAPAVVRFAADGQSLLSAGREGTLAAWRGAAAVSLALEGGVPSALALGPGNGTLVASADGRVRLVDPAGAGPARVVAEGLAVPVTLAMRPDQQRLAVGDGAGSVRVIETAGWQTLQSLEVGAAVTALAWRADGQRLAAGVAAADGAPARIALFGPPVPPAQPQPGRELAPHDTLAVAAEVVRLAFDRGGRDVWACQADGRLTRHVSGAPAALLKLDHGGAVLAVAVSQDGGTIVSAGADRIVRVWDGTTGQQRAQLQGHEGPIHALALSPDEALVVSAGADKTLRLWDLGGARQLKILATTPETVYGVAIDPGGTQVAAGGADRTVRLLNLATGAAEGALAGHGDFVQSVAYAPSGAVLLSCGYAGEVRFWGRAGGAPLADTRVGRIGNHAAFDPAGARIVVSGGDGTATILDVPAAARP